MCIQNAKNATYCHRFQTTFKAVVRRWFYSLAAKKHDLFSSADLVIDELIHHQLQREENNL